jgi:hypothetical protein
MTTLPCVQRGEQQARRPWRSRWARSLEVEHRPDRVRCHYVLNEGGAHHVQHEGRRLNFVETGEKGVAQFKVVVNGRIARISSPPR